MNDTPHSKILCLLHILHQIKTIFIETKVAFMDSFCAMIKDGMVDAVALGGSSGIVQEVLEVLLPLTNLPTASSTQLRSRTMSVGSVPFSNCLLLEDYDDTLYHVFILLGHVDSHTDILHSLYRAIARINIVNGVWHVSHLLVHHRLSRVLNKSWFLCRGLLYAFQGPWNR